MNKYLSYSLSELVKHYLTFLVLWNTGNLYSDRSEVHEALFEKLGLNTYDRSDDINANKILHNLDKEIGYIIGVEYNEEEIDKMSKRLENKLRVKD